MRTSLNLREDAIASYLLVAMSLSSCRPQSVIDAPSTRLRLDASTCAAAEALSVGNSPADG
jgi:hypothetical protein